LQKAIFFVSSFDGLHLGIGSGWLRGSRRSISEKKLFGTVRNIDCISPMRPFVVCLAANDQLLEDSAKRKYTIKGF